MKSWNYWMNNLILFVQSVGTVITFLLLTDTFKQVNYRLNIHNAPMFIISLLLIAIAVKLSLINLVAYFCLGFIFSLIFVLLLSSLKESLIYKISVGLLTFLFWMHMIILMFYTFILLPPEEDDATF